MANGSIRKSKNKDGTWSYRLRLDYRDPATGERKQPQYSFPTRRDAEDARTTLNAELLKGQRPSDRAVTLGEYAAEWLDTLADRSPGTRHSYDQLLRLHILPGLGHVPLRTLTPRHVERWIAAERADGTGAATLHGCHARLVQILRRAVRDELVPRNVAALVDAPAYTPSAGQAWSQEQALAFLDVCATEARFPAYWTLLLATGMRRGEALGLRWKQVDEKAGAIHITQQRTIAGAAISEGVPKSRKSRTVMAAPSLFAVLRDHRAQQDALRATAASLTPWPPSDYVFLTPEGKPLHPNSPTVEFARLVALAPVPRIRLHDLRHSFATLSLSEGVDLAVVSEALGHSSISITLNTYRHVYDKRRDELANTMENLLFSRPKEGQKQAS